MFFSPVLAAVTILGLAAPALANASPSADDRELVELVELLLERVQKIEARVNRLEPGNDSLSVVPAIYVMPSDPTAPAGASIEESLLEAAGSLANLERALDGSNESGPIQDPPSSADAGSEPERASRQSAYLPSRGWLEGMYYGSESSKIEVHAFVDLEYVDAGPDGSRSGVSTFDNYHSNVFVETELRPNLAGHVEIEFEHSGDEVEIDQAYVEWAATEWLSLSAGRFYAPFGIERFVWYSPTNALASRPEPMRQIIPGNFYANGLMAAGNVGIGEQSTFTWELAVSDGLGDLAATSRRASRQTRDNNSNRALTGRAAFAPTRNIELGASYHHQRYSSEGNLGLDFVGLDFSGRYRGWELRAEWVDASVDRLSGLDLSQDGYYTQLGYTFHRASAFVPAVSLVGRWDVVDLDQDVTGNDDQEFFSLGVNTAVYEHLRFKVEYRWISEDGLSRDNDTFLSQFVIDF